MSDKSFSNIKEVLEKVSVNENYDFSFLLKLLEIEVQSDSNDEEKIKYLKDLIDLEEKNVQNK